jgi:hypothetical protein
VGEVYSFLGLRGLMGGSRSVGDFDNAVVDGAVDGFAGSFRRLGGTLRKIQRGALQENLLIAFSLIVGGVVLYFFVF